MPQPLTDVVPAPAIEGPPRRVGRVPLGALAVVAALVAVGLILWAVLGRDAAEAPPPPLADVEGPQLLLSAEVAPPGAEVLGVIVDETDSGQAFIDMAGVEEWHDGAWVDDGRLLLWCLPDDDCLATVTDPGVTFDFAPTDIEPTSAEPGPVMRMTTEGLEPGWYRIAHTSESGVRVSAVLEIDDDAPVPAVLSPLDE